MAAERHVLDYERAGEGYPCVSYCPACADDAAWLADGGSGPDEPDDSCTSPTGHEWGYTGTAYGGDDHSYFGEGRCLCVHCGADGDA